MKKRELERLNERYQDTIARLAKERDDAEFERDQLVAFLGETAAAVENESAPRPEIAALLLRARARFVPTTQETP